MDPTKQEKIQLKRLCNRGHQGLWHPQPEEMMGIQDVLCLAATGFVKVNVAKAHPQARKGCCGEKFFSRCYREKVAFPASSQSLHGHITKKTKHQKNTHKKNPKPNQTNQTKKPQTNNKNKKINPNLTTGHPRPHGKTDLHQLSSQEQIF